MYTGVVGVILKSLSKISMYITFDVEEQRGKHGGSVFIAAIMLSPRINRRL